MFPLGGEDRFSILLRAAEGANSRQLQNAPRCLVAANEAGADVIYKAGGGSCQRWRVRNMSVPMSSHSSAPGYASFSWARVSEV